MVGLIDEAKLKLGDAGTVLHARDDCCARPTGGDPTNAERRG